MLISLKYLNAQISVQFLCNYYGCLFLDLNPLILFVFSCLYFIFNDKILTEYLVV